MANTDKDILITPNVGSSSADPKIEFKGADASTSAQTITATAYPTNNGTLSFDGSAGQLFSITNDMTGTIFSVNDVSGIPSIEVDDDGTIRFAEYSGNVLIGTATDDGSKLQVNGSATVSNNITASNVYVADRIYHEGDTDTSISFGANVIALNAGGSQEITVTPTGVQLGDTGNGYFQPVSGDYGSIQIDGGAHTSWEGYSIGGRAVFMHNNSTTTGIYNDVDNEWLLNCTHNGATYLYHNGSIKFTTQSWGASVTGTLVAGAVEIDGQLDIEEVHEKVTTDTTTTGTYTFDTSAQGIVYFTANQTANRTINFSNVNSTLGTGQSVTCTALVTNGSTAYYLNAYQVDGTAVTPKWAGGSAPSGGTASGIDVYTFTIIKTADATFTVLASLTAFS
jgi:hypothetical protein